MHTNKHVGTHTNTCTRTQAHAHTQARAPRALGQRRGSGGTVGDTASPGSPVQGPLTPGDLALASRLLVRERNPP